MEPPADGQLDGASVGHNTQLHVSNSVAESVFYHVFHAKLR
jgi:hypothetical protein